MLLQGQFFLKDPAEASVELLLLRDPLLAGIQTGSCLLNPNVNLDVPSSIGLVLIVGSTADPWPHGAWQPCVCEQAKAVHVIQLPSFFKLNFPKILVCLSDFRHT